MNSSLFTLLTMFIILLDSSTSDTVTAGYKDCSYPTSCGKVQNIGYPFWGVGGRPRECGIPNPVFNLTCPSNSIYDYPVLRINDQYDNQSHPPSYKVLSINSSAYSIKLLTQYPQHTNCSVPLHEPAFSGRPFEYSSSVEMMDLLECKHYPSPEYEYKYDDTNSVLCTNSYGNITLWYSYLQNLQTVSQNCKNLRVPVFGQGLKDLKGNRITLEGLFRMGFEVDYPRDNFLACNRCKSSGGICGSSDHISFTCFCKNQHTSQHYYSCPKSEKLKHILEIGGLFVLAALIFCQCCCLKEKFWSQTWLSRILSYHRLRSDLEMGNTFFGIPLFSFTELQEATNNFDPQRVLGDGAFGVVYYGKLTDGREVAVKRLYEKNYKRVGQFMNEVDILTKLSHPNLVTLYGCTSRHCRELLLVYDFIPNGTVSEHLYGKQSHSKSLTWPLRTQIALQTAEALSYLHTSDIIHRDVKTNNILLDSNFSVKVADFGLSRLFPSDVTHLSTAPQGTPGYLEPEYHKCYQVTRKSDVYSFGVVLVELISSLPAVDMDRSGEEINLSAYGVNKIQNGKIGELVDQSLGYESDFKVKRMVNLVAELAFQCLQQDREVRPSMEEVLQVLKKIQSLNSEELGGQNDLNCISSPKSVIVGWSSGRSTTSNNSDGKS